MVDPRTPPRGNRVSSNTKSAQIECWTVEQTAQRLSTTFTSAHAATCSRDTVRGTSTPLSIPLDTPVAATPPAPPALFPVNLPVSSPPAGSARSPARATTTPDKEEAVHTVHRRVTPIRRDSQKRREALLKGKEGSRRRQRWENDRLLHVPGAQAPLPSDWAVPVPGEGRTDELYRPVPYSLAGLWEGRYQELRKEREELERRRRMGRVVPDIPPEGLTSEERRERRQKIREEEQRFRAEMEKEQLARELRNRMKKSRGARGLLQDLESEVRNFLMQTDYQNRLRDEDADFVDIGRDDSDDEEIVFIGRNGAMKERTKSENQRFERLIFESLEKDHGAAFGRWLVHSIADYYGLETWSVTTGDPARREAYVGLKPDARPAAPTELPRPLWIMV